MRVYQHLPNRGFGGRAPNTPTSRAEGGGPKGKPPERVTGKPSVTGRYRPGGSECSYSRARAVARRANRPSELRAVSRNGQSTDPEGRNVVTTERGRWPEGQAARASHGQIIRNGQVPTRRVGTLARATSGGGPVRASRRKWRGMAGKLPTRRVGTLLEPKFRRWPG